MRFPVIGPVVGAVPVTLPFASIGLARQALLGTVPASARKLLAPGDTGSVQLPASAPLPNPTLFSEITAPVADQTIVSKDGTRLHVRVFGRPGAQPLVLSHGWTCSTEFWRPQINALADEFRVITYDQRGHGRSELGRARLSPELLADDFSSVLSGTLAPGERAVLVGHSMGGMTIMSWADKHRAEVARYASSALLLSTASDRLTAEELVIPPMLRNVPGRPVLVHALISAPVPTGLLPSEILRYATMGTASTPEQREFCRTIVNACPRRVRGMWGTVLGRLDIANALDNLVVPTSVLVGSADRLTPPVHSYRIKDRLEMSGNLESFSEIAGIGHMSPVEAPEMVVSEIRRLAGIPASHRRVG
ncbi:alpha/beta fold hydrolase [Hoyosella subflava]|uniref:Hydrolase n=1 Tax=Hoyosella subflava (strain DSM 45089 / JCM 17490 / NBRC 109087 / DQS3-9A1) TaxID=443218 RepID=F6EJL9_HOYSD|nr:alpha/beta hydrolase [Hoyosella subflava]AEF39068.1 Hydrolase [Hoyosella subflava DQS3-9A1]